MKIFKDLITGDEVLSDTYDINIVDDVIYEGFPFFHYFLFHFLSN
jgi:hypothetical protein